MAHHVPIAGGVLSVIGSVFVLLAGIVLAVIGTAFSFLLGAYSGLLFIGLIVGILMLIISILIFVMPQMKVAWGALIIVFSIVSLPFALGGFLIGFILGLIGGILTIVYKSPPQAAPMGAPMPPPPGTMSCPACGGMVNMQTRTCMSCGRQV